MESAKKVYISIPESFLRVMDEIADEEHLSRSGLIREAVKLYMEVRKQPGGRLQTMVEKFRKGFERHSEEEVFALFDKALQDVRRKKKR